MGFHGLWLKRVWFSFKTIFQFSSLFSFLGLILAVAVLTVAVLIINSFSSGLEKALIDRQGHIHIQTSQPVLKEELLKSLSPYKDSFANQALFLSFEALILKAEQFKAVLVSAIEDDKLQSLSFIKNRLLEGSLNSASDFIIVGSELAKELNLSVGSDVSLIISQNKDSHLSKKQAQFKISAIIDFGHYEFNSSLALMPLSSAKALGLHHISGANLWLKNKKHTDLIHKKIQDSLKDMYLVQTWKDGERDFFKVIESDKKIIFFVLLILIISAGFNVSSSLFVQVFKKTKDISILKAMGAKQKLIRNLFLLNGLIVGCIGSAFGILAGALLSYFLVFIQNKWHFIPSQAYQVSKIIWAWNSLDLALIFIVSLIVVILSSVLPARRAYKMSVTKGLSYN